MPLLFPVINSRGRAVKDLHVIVFPNAIKIYYSYQVPIAFFSQDKLYIRDGFWSRRRGIRQKVHIRVIAEDSASIGGTEVIDSKEFLADLHDELDYFGIGFSGGSNRSTYTAKQKVAKRRIVL